jgi:hypothetical protein
VKRKVQGEKSFLPYVDQQKKEVDDTEQAYQFLMSTVSRLFFLTLIFQGEEYHAIQTSISGF